MPRPQIFISHITPEKELALLLKKQLDRAFLGMLDIFVSSDGTSIEAGAPWLDTLNDSLQRATLALFLLSKESIARPWVNFEAGACWVRKVPIIPICHSGMKLPALPPPFSVLQAKEAGDADGLRAVYDRIAKELDASTPDLNFDALAAELRAVEERYLVATEGLDRVEKPSVLCAASEAYSSWKEIGFEGDVRVLSASVPEGALMIEPKMTSQRVRTLLTTRKFDLVHLVTEVDMITGDIVFSPTDRMSKEGFTACLRESGTRLTVLATCHALTLAIEVASVSNLIATIIAIDAQQAERWASCFYGFLFNSVPLYKAFELTRANCDVPMQLIKHRDRDLKIVGRADPQSKSV